MSYDAAVIGSGPNGLAAAVTLAQAAVISLMGRWNWWLPHWPARLLRVEPSALRARA